ncbi:sigma-70 family RNA polymerase sigma factor [Streptococcus catagoni]|uniref:sigma-70 family RNA polymerase sigma factor n=1 Tax=Streptococcus catagoni TaxID=2654874 RepID=UPI0014073B37|nr:sigma-70 family RNA polymerase sigma factor [Streptococcus catagoni]
MEKFEHIFQKIKPIILKFKRSYYIQLWESDDWLQEGRLILYRLLTDQPEIISDHKRLYSYFKTKFSSHLKDILRYQESKKRKFNKMPYIEISEVGHRIAGEGLFVDDYIAYHSVIKEVSHFLDEVEREQLSKLMRGEQFVGRKALLRKIKPYFIDF